MLYIITFTFDVVSVYLIYNFTKYLYLSLPNSITVGVMATFFVVTDRTLKYVFSRLVFEIFEICCKEFNLQCKYNAKLHPYFVSISLPKAVYLSFCLII